MVILSYRFAEGRFGSPANAIGQNILLKGRSFQVIGVAPRNFEGMFGERTELWAPSSAVIPLAIDSQDGRLWKLMNVFYALAASELRTPKQLTTDLSKSLPIYTGSESRLHVSPGLTEDPVRDEHLRARLRLGLALSVAFTLVSGLNLAWLLLAQAPLRATETHLKKALGADTVRLICEGAMGPSSVIGLGFVGAGILLAAGVVAISGMTGIGGQVARGAWQTAILAYAMEIPFVGVLTCLVVVLPLISVLRDVSGTRRYYSLSALRVSALMNIPVVLQISLVSLTCILAGMVSSALISEMNEFLGYDPSQLMVVEISPSSGTLEMSWSGSEVSPTMRALGRLIVHAASIPGVGAVAYSSSPVGVRDEGVPCLLERIDSEHSSRLTVRDVTVSPGYTRTVGGKFIEGRDFPPGGGGNEIILNEAAAHALWPTQSPVNRPVQVIEPAMSGLPSNGSPAIVVGVVADMKTPGYGHHALPTIYRSMFKTGVMDFSPRLILRGVVSWAAVDSGLGKEVRAQLPGMAIRSVYPIRDRIRAVFANDAEGTYLAITGAVVMVAVSSIGLYASLAYFVRTRRRDLAIRMCLGASSSAIRRIVYGRAVFRAVLGVLLGVVVWPSLAQLSAVDYLGPVSWSLGRAVAISAVCVGMSSAIAHLAARETAELSLAQMLKQD